MSPLSVRHGVLWLPVGDEVGSLGRGEHQVSQHLQLFDGGTVVVFVVGVWPADGVADFSCDLGVRRQQTVEKVFLA